MADVVTTGLSSREYSKLPELKGPIKTLSTFIDAELLNVYYLDMENNECTNTEHMLTMKSVNIFVMLV